MNGNSAMQSLYARAKFYGVGIRQGFDFWRFHTPTTINFGVFGKFSGVYYAKTPITRALYIRTHVRYMSGPDVKPRPLAHLDQFKLILGR